MTGPGRITPAKVLLVDDEPDLLNTCVRLLGQAGHTCLIAQSAGEALGMIDSEPLDLVVTDLRLPTLNGLAVARHARRASPPLPVVLMTGYTSTGAQQAALAAGAIVFLAKPFSAAEFLDAVVRGLGK